MSKTIGSERGRWLMLFLVVGGFMADLGALFYTSRGGAIHPDNVRMAISATVDMFLPILGAMGGFFIAQGLKRKDKQLSKQAFVFAFVITAFWVIAPSLLYLLTDMTVEDIFQLLGGLKAGFANTVVLGSVTYLFGSSR